MPKSGTQHFTHSLRAFREHPIPVRTQRPATPATQPSPGVRVAEAELKPNQLQDLADIVGDLVHAAVGHDLKFRVRVELRSTDSKSEETVGKINKALKEVAPELQMN